MAPTPPAEEQPHAYEEPRAYHISQSNNSSVYTPPHSSDRSSLEPSKATKRTPVFSDYKPTALRWWFHLILIACLATAIGLTQYAINSLGVPHALPSTYLPNVTETAHVQDAPREVAEAMEVLESKFKKRDSSTDDHMESIGGTAPEMELAQLNEAMVNQNRPPGTPIQHPGADETSHGFHAINARDGGTDVLALPTGISGVLAQKLYYIVVGKHTYYLKRAEPTGLHPAEGDGSPSSESGSLNNAARQTQAIPTDSVLGSDGERLGPGNFIMPGVTELRNRALSTPAPTPTNFLHQKLSSFASVTHERQSGSHSMVDYSVSRLPSTREHLGHVVQATDGNRLRTGQDQLHPKRNNSGAPDSYTTTHPVHNTSNKAEEETGMGSAPRNRYLILGPGKVYPKRNQSTTVYTKFSPDRHIPDFDYSLRLGYGKIHQKRNLSTRPETNAPPLPQLPENHEKSTDAAVGGQGDSDPVPGRGLVLQGGAMEMEKTEAVQRQGMDQQMSSSTLLADFTEVPADQSKRVSGRDLDTMTVSLGETLVTQPSVVAVTVGGTTRTLKSTFSDSEGLHTSSRTTVVGATPTSATIAVMVTISVAQDQEVVTLQEVLPTTLGGTTEVLETTFTDSLGHRASSLHTTVRGGTATSAIVWTVIATSAPRGETLVTIPTVFPLTVGGSTKLTTKTLKGSQGTTEKSTFTTTMSGTLTSTTLWTVVATPTPARITGLPSNSSTSSSNPNPTAGEPDIITVGITTQEYLLAAFLPTILAVLVSFPIKLIAINAKLFHPFHALATADQTRGSAPENSIFLRFYGWAGMTSFIRALRQGQPVVAISDVLVLGSALLAPLAAETIAVYQAVDDCVYNCYGTIGVSLVQGRLLQGVMSVLVVLLILLLLSVRRWKTGVNQNPWSIAAMASLCLDAELRAMLRSLPRGLDGKVKESSILKSLSTKTYGIGYPRENFGPSFQTYGVTVIGSAPIPATQGVQANIKSSATGPRKASQPFLLLTWWSRCIMLFIFASIITMLVYYDNTSGETGFELFMDSQSFGVKFLFTSLGVILGYSMETVFRCVAIMSPYLRLSKTARRAEQSILCSPPTNAFYGMWSAFRQRHLYLGFLSFATILAELCLPVTLSHVPFSAVETYMTQIVSAYLSVAILSLMMIAVILSFFIKWPHMPVDPRTIAGAMYYVCDSWMLGSMEGLSSLGKDDRDLDVRFMRHRYGYGCVDGMHWENRMGFDIVESRDETAVGQKRQRYG